MTINDNKRASNQYLTFYLAGQMFGVSVLQVNDVLRAQKTTRTPLAPPTIGGIMNLRGRIVTVIDVRRCLNQKQRPAGEESMSVVVEQNGELFSLVIDAVGDVLTLEPSHIEPVPPTLDPEWGAVAAGIYKLPERLLVTLDVKKLLAAAASHGDVMERVI